MSEANTAVDPAKTLLDMDTLDNMDMSGVVAAPEFVDPPKGRYACLVQAKFEPFDKEDKETGIAEQGTRIRLIYSIQSVLELKDNDELQPPKGSLFSETFMGTQQGMTYFKTRAQAIIGDLGNAKVGEVVKVLTENKTEFAVNIGRRKSKSKDKDGVEKEYENITVRVVGEADPAVTQ